MTLSACPGLEEKTRAGDVSSISGFEGTQLGQLMQTGQRGILFLMMSCTVYKLGELAGGQQLLTGDRLGIVHCMVSNCISASLVLCISIYIIITIIIIPSFTFLLNFIYLNPQDFTFSHSPSHPTG